MIPLYRVCMHLGLLNTFAGVILPFGVSAFGIFLMRQFYRSIPMELDDAARMDGCSPFRIWWNILVPLSRPALATLAVFTFVGSWSNFLWPLVILRDSAKLTLPVGLSLLVSTFSANYKFVAAGAVLSTIPVIIVFLVMQRAFIQGLLSGGVKS
jgi:putative chitobiose transport system permease protein